MQNWHFQNLGMQSSGLSLWSHLQPDSSALLPQALSHSSFMDSSYLFFCLFVFVKSKNNWFVARRKLESPSRHKKIISFCCPEKATASKNAKTMVVMMGTVIKLLKRINSLTSCTSEVKENTFLHRELGITTSFACWLKVQLFHSLLMLTEISQECQEEDEEKLIQYHRNIISTKL